MARGPVFVSYRRADAKGEAGRLADALQRALGRAAVFRDAEGLAPGQDFTAALERQLAGSRAVIVVMGTGWLSELGARLSRPEPDWVRIEIATALRLGKLVVPVLLGGATMPAPDALPEDLRPLALRQAITLRDEAWALDLERLLDAIGRPYRWGWLAVRALGALVAAVALTFGLVRALDPEPEAGLWISRASVLGLLAAWAAVEVARARRRP